MARVNHKTLMRLMNEKKSKIRDRQFFTSRLMAGHFEEMAAVQTGKYRYNRRVRVSICWKPDDGDVASTDGREIRINAGHPSVTKTRGRQERYWNICGLFAHELGHVLYTDFLCSQTYFNALAQGRWFPAVPDTDTLTEKANASEILEYIAEEQVNKNLVRKMAHTICNILEDGYIENRLLNEFPGTLGMGLLQRRKLDWEDMPDMTQAKEKEDCEDGHIFQSILQALLSYALYGEIKYGDEPLKDERIQAAFNTVGLIDQALMSDEARNRFSMANAIMVKLWGYMKDYLEWIKECQKDITAGGGTSSAESLLDKGLEGLSGMPGSIPIGTGTSVNSPEKEKGGTASPVTAGKREKTRKDMEESSTETDGTDAGAGTEPAGKENDSAAGKDDSGDDGTVHASGGDEGQKMDASAHGQPGPDMEAGSQTMEGKERSGGKQEVTEEETERIPLQNTSSVVVPEDGSITRNEDYERECNNRAAADIERMLEKMAEKQACEQMENERTRELNELARSISYGDIHKGVDVRINRISSVDAELAEQYDGISGSLLRISRQMQRSIEKQLKESRRGGKLTGLVMGRRLDAHALCRDDGKVFYKTSLPAESPELAVGLLLDESGSMSGCDRATYARATAIIMHDFCTSLGIPVMIYGHSTGGNSVELFSYSEFDSIDRDDRYRLMDISARGGNRDGAALRYVAEQLSKHPAELKLLILVSDGQPADSGYYGTEAEADLRGICREYKRKGIIFVAAAIGDDKENIQRIYGDSFMDITDLEQLPAKLTGVVKKHIRV